MLFDKLLERLLRIGERCRDMHVYMAGSIAIVQVIPPIEPIGEVLRGCFDSDGVCRPHTTNAFRIYGSLSVSQRTRCGGRTLSWIRHTCAARTGGSLR